MVAQDAHIYGKAVRKRIDVTMPATDYRSDYFRRRLFTEGSGKLAPVFSDWLEVLWFFRSMERGKHLRTSALVAIQYCSVSQGAAWWCRVRDFGRLCNVL